MTAAPSAGDTEELFLARLTTVAPFLGLEASAIDELAERGMGPLLATVAQRLKTLDSRELVWLTLAVLGAAFPEEATVLACARALRASEPGLEHRAVLSALGNQRHRLMQHVGPVVVVTDAVLVDVDFCARYSHNTGIQRVVRQTVSRWQARGHDMSLVAWLPHARAYRRLTPLEEKRVVAWGESADHDTQRPASESLAEVVIPFRSTVVIAEVPHLMACHSLAALAAVSGNTCSFIAYDMIPVVSATAVSSDETRRFLAYLTFVKHATRGVAISESTAREFRGFAASLASQGLIGPEIATVSLPVATHKERVDSLEGVTDHTTTVPLVLCVGSVEARKNQDAVLAAAEQVWKRGVRFRLEFVGGGTTARLAAFEKKLRASRRRGHDVALRTGVTDTELAATYERAAMTVFPSLHEGYGLPVAESLAYGVPVITSAFGATEEIARHGGCVLVDPRSDIDIADAMERLLVNPGARAELVASIGTIPHRTWQDYADESWPALTGRDGAYDHV